MKSTTPRKRRVKVVLLRPATPPDPQRFKILEQLRNEQRRRAEKENWDEDTKECYSAVTLLMRVQADGLLPGWPSWEQVAAKYGATPQEREQHKRHPSQLLPPLHQ